MWIPNDRSHSPVVSATSTKYFQFWKGAKASNISYEEIGTDFLPHWAFFHSTDFLIDRRSRNHSVAWQWNALIAHRIAGKNDLSSLATSVDADPSTPFESRYVSGSSNTSAHEEHVSKGSSATFLKASNMVRVACLCLQNALPYFLRQLSAILRPEIKVGLVRCP